ncbi:MAG: F0F1 ATP synthase subunit A [Candidatus Gracilibacteria bacterium]|nr:F0F1 ATP synthase subunit A [Candidatus Gracilibacteria bacterium]
MDISINNFLGSYYIVGENGHGILNPFFVGIMLEFILLLVVYFFVTKKPNSSFSVFFDMVFEGVYGFFEDILGIDEKKWTKLYITSMFFVILFSNLSGAVLEVIGVGIGVIEKGSNLALLAPDKVGDGILSYYIEIPTSDINFNVAMAVIGVIIVIYEQFKFLGIGKALYEYFPVLGKNYIPYERGNKSKFIDIPLFLLVKFFDIVISLFLGILDIVGHLAKVISLSFRLFGNITSGGMLLGMLLLGLGAGTKFLVGFEFPVVVPVILHLQGILVSLIQALVFPLLIAIFIKVAKVH